MNGMLFILVAIFTYSRSETAILLVQPEQVQPKLSELTFFQRRHTHEKEVEEKKTNSEAEG